MKDLFNFQELFCREQLNNIYNVLRKKCATACIGNMNKNSFNDTVFSRFTTPFLFKHHAFTLAEVLITLGIIGVVAALTMPSLIQNYKEKETVSRVKKAYSTISQAYASALQENGSPETWGLVSFDMVSEIDEENILYYLKPYLQINEYCGSKPNVCWSSTNSVAGISFPHATAKYYSKAVLSDGTAILSLVTSPVCGASSGQINDICGLIRIDINGKKLPNMHGRDVFSFHVTKDKIVPTGTQLERKDSGSSFENGCVGGAQGRGCTAWLLYNENMDYLHCPEKLGWDKAHSCK